MPNKSPYPYQGKTQHNPWHLVTYCLHKAWSSAVHSLNWSHRKNYSPTDYTLKNAPTCMLGNCILIDISQPKVAHLKIDIYVVGKKGRACLFTEAFINNFLEENERRQQGQQEIWRN